MKFYRILLVAVFLVALRLFGVSSVAAQGRVFTVEELAQYDGKDGHQAYYAYEGVVYDVTDSPLWKLGEHLGHQAGKDLTGRLEGAPHGDDIVKAMTVVGTLQGVIVPSSSPVAATAEATSGSTESGQAWYLNPIRVVGLSLVLWSGILAVITLVLSLVSYFAMLKNQIASPLEMLHRLLTWMTVILGVVFAVLGVMQLLGWSL